jgi:ABC-type transporter Mla subunit MlaD
MLKHLLVAAVLVAAPVVTVGCGSKDPNTAESAKGDQSPVEELRGITDDLSKDVDAIVQPINDVDAVVQALDDLPRKYGMKASDLKVMAKGVFDGGDVTVSADVKPEARDEVLALLQKIKGIATGLKTTPDKVQALLGKLPPTVAKVPVLYSKAQASLQVKANNPFGNSDEKAKAKSDLQDLDKVKTDIMTKIDGVKTTVTGLPDKATQAVTKLKGALG